MIIEVPENVSKKIVVKRDGKKVEFDGAKIAIAIQKGFGDITGNEFSQNTKYNETDINKVYTKVLQRISKKDSEKIKIEEIQDLIEEELKNNGYEDVYESFSSYREKRAQSRQLFFDEKKQHKFLKALENLALKNTKDIENKNETTMGTMLQYGSSISKQFAVTYLMKKRFEEANENGDIHIFNMAFLPMGTTDCSQIDLHKLFKDGFFVENTFIREPKNILTYSTLATIAIQANQNDQYGEQSIPALDYYFAPGVLLTFKKQLKQKIFDYLELTDFDKFIAVNGIEREIEKINTIEINPKIFYKYCRESEELKRLFNISYNKAIEETKQITYQAIEAFIYNLNTMYSKGGAKLPFSCVNFGTDTSAEGRLITKAMLQIQEKQDINYMFPIMIFKIKEGVNYNKNEPNYDLFEMATNIDIKKKLPNFSFLDASFNKQYYKDGDYDTEVAYTASGARVLENIVDQNKEITPGRGVLATTAINLPRLGIKYGSISNEKEKIKEFYKELEEKLDLVKDQLLERFEIQCKKRGDNFPFLMLQGVWIDSEKLKENDNLKKVLKQGALQISFIGLAECLKALLGKHHGESEKSQKFGLEIIEFMRKKCDEYSEKYNLNFNLSANLSDEILGKFSMLDQAIYGKLKNITDKKHYTNSFCIPDEYEISTEKKLKIEAPYHKHTNGGHITQITLKKQDDIKEIIKLMKELEIGYTSFK